MSINAFPKWKPGVKSQNLRPKPEPEVVLAAILDSEGARSCKNAFIWPLWHQKAIIAGASEIP